MWFAMITSPHAGIPPLRREEAEQVCPPTSPQASTRLATLPPAPPHHSFLRPYPVTFLLPLPQQFPHNWHSGIISHFLQPQADLLQTPNNSFDCSLKLLPGVRYRILLDVDRMFFDWLLGLSWALGLGFRGSDNSPEQQSFVDWSYLYLSDWRICEWM